eukprot:COSAG01_NODE_1254_length_11042_cov_37.493192_1_plen_326_part_10
MHPLGLARLICRAPRHGRGGDAAPARWTAAALPRVCRLRPRAHGTGNQIGRQPQPGTQSRTHIPTAATESTAVALTCELFIHPTRQPTWKAWPQFNSSFEEHPSLDIAPAILLDSRGSGLVVRIMEVVSTYLASASALTPPVSTSPVCSSKGERQTAHIPASAGVVAAPVTGAVRSASLPASRVGGAPARSGRGGPSTIAGALAGSAHCHCRTAVPVNTGNGGGRWCCSSSFAAPVVLPRCSTVLASGVPELLHCARLRSPASGRGAGPTIPLRLASWRRTLYELVASRARRAGRDCECLSRISANSGASYGSQSRAWLPGHCTGR